MKKPAPNEQFATSGGATRPSGSAEQQFSALVRTLPIPPPAASCHHVRGNATDCVKELKNNIFKNKILWIHLP